MERIAGGGPRSLQQHQAAVLNSLLALPRLGRMAELEIAGGDIYPVREFLEDVRTALWRDAAVTARDPYRRALQRAHVNRLASLLNEPEGTSAAAAAARFTAAHSDVRPLARAQLSQNASTAASRTSDVTARAHLLDVVQRVDAALAPPR
jgi:hypothetical protein